MAGDLVKFETGRGHPVAIAQFDPFDPLHRQHSRRGQVNVDLRDADRGVAGKIALELLHVAFFAAKVQLAPQHPLEFGHRRPRPVVDELRNPFGHLGQSREDLQVYADLLLDPRVLDLDHHGLSAGQTSSMDLSDGCRGERLVFELQKQLLDRLSQLLLDDPPHDVRRIGRHVCLQFFQLFGQLHAHHVGAGAEDLAQLDEGGPQFAERQADAGFTGLPSEDFAAAVLEPALGKFEVKAAEPVGQAVFAEHREDFAPPIDVPIDLRDGGDFHQTDGPKYRALPGRAAGPSGSHVWCPPPARL